MAASRSKQSKKITVKLVTGTKSGGGAQTKTLSFGNINPSLSDDLALQIGQSIGGLQSHDVDSVGLADTCELNEEE